MIDRKEHKDLAEDKLVRDHTQGLVPVDLSRVRRRLERHRAAVTATTTTTTAAAAAATRGQLRVCICICIQPALALTPIPSMMRWASRARRPSRRIL